MDIRLLSTYSSIYIVGAQSRAKTLTGYFRLLYPDTLIEAYLVDDLSQNDRYIGNVPVLSIEADCHWNMEDPVLIATKGIYHQEIVGRLKQIGFHRIIPVTYEVDNQLRNQYVRRTFEIQGRSFVRLDELPEALNEEKLADFQMEQYKIYMAKSVYDKPLNNFYNNPAYECAIQVGAALTQLRLEDGILLDCDGDNISRKNRQYCELTALYWIWKNAGEAVVGLSHYRRHFVLPENWQTIMYSCNVDVVLPVPTCVLSSIDKNYRERHTESDWDFLLEYMQKNYKEDYETARTVFSGTLYSPCNMFIAKKKIVDDLCQWMFPIVDAVAMHGGEHEDSYLNRYPGFISERLITLYFYMNREKYNIVYADKNFIQ